MNKGLQYNLTLEFKRTLIKKLFIAVTLFQNIKNRNPKTCLDFRFKLERISLIIVSIQIPIFERYIPILERCIPILERCILILKGCIPITYNNLN